MSFGMITDHAKAIEVLKRLLSCPELDGDDLLASSQLAIEEAYGVIEKYDTSWGTLWQLLKSKSKKSE